MKRICIFTAHDISSAYSCLLYLQEELEKNFDTHIYGFGAKKKMPKSKQNKYHSFYDMWYGKIKKFRVFVMKVHAYLIAKKFDVIIVNDLDFFKTGYFIKKMNPGKKIIHYNTEIHGPDVPYSRNITRFYENNADFPDMIIECLSERARYRKEKFKIKKDIFVINNTLPLKEINSIITSNNCNKYFESLNSKLLTLVYAGGCDLSRSLGDIINSASKFENKINFLFFCYGDKKNFNIVKNECNKHPNCFLFEAVNRRTLLNILKRCDIGVQYYDPNYSSNFRYASPSKFYEYVAVGLNVISSNNIGINKIIDDNNLGICFNEDEGFSVGIEKLLAKGMNTKENIIEYFKNNLCYEIDSKNAIEEIIRLVLD